MYCYIQHVQAHNADFSIPFFAATHINLQHFQCHEVNGPQNMDRVLECAIEDAPL
jgi:hypothetical protein